MAAKDMDNSAESANQNKVMAQAFLDSGDIDSFNKKLEAIKLKMDSLTKEGTEIREKHKKLEAEVNALNK